MFFEWLKNICLCSYLDMFYLGVLMALQCFKQLLKMFALRLCCDVVPYSLFTRLCCFLASESDLGFQSLLFGFSQYQKLGKQIDPDQQFHLSKVHTR